jgi:Eukaryotic phosphomannomutase
MSRVEDTRTNGPGTAPAAISLPAVCCTIFHGGRWWSARYEAHRLVRRGWHADEAAQRACPAIHVAHCARLSLARTRAPCVQRVTDEMLAFLRELRGKVHIGMVGGSDLHKQQEQLGDDGAFAAGVRASAGAEWVESSAVFLVSAVLDLFDLSFPQNGLQYYKGRTLVASTSLGDRITDEQATAFVSFTLRRIADMEIPVKTGTFIERRTGMFNVSPVGRNCTQKQRDEFEAFDHAHGIRKALIADLEATFPHLGLQYSIGGQISKAQGVVGRVEGGGCLVVLWKMVAISPPPPHAHVCRLRRVPAGVDEAVRAAVRGGGGVLGDLLLRRQDLRGRQRL